MTVNNNQKYTALLLDLDGTLLILDIEQFIPAYIDALSRRFIELIDRELFIKHLIGTTNKMVANDDPDRNNETIFYQEFCGRTGLTYGQIKPIIDDFYRDDFPKLSCWGKEHPHARELIKTARQKDMQLVLATNPIFPAIAVHQRLAWGGLDKDNFHLITTMENMHFCKPNLHYYLEISAKIGCPPEECLMAGNDTHEDLIAAKVGMDTYLVDDYILNRIEGEAKSDHRGKLEDLIGFIKTLDG
ncbi:MAG: HAD hydrolase-like protein [Bacillota bacterium]|nr:HAD hydrolase-like protein [Bacillota bacterium]